MWHQLTWSHYKLLISLHSIDKINYYSFIAIKNNCSVRQLDERIKSREYERIDKPTKVRMNDAKNLEINDLLKNPIVLHSSINYINISEKYLKKLILENMDNFLKELGYGFTYVGNEYKIKIKIGNSFNYIDILLFNIKFNCYIVVELKVCELKKDHIGQIQIYMNYIDKNVKEIFHEKTIGLIICKRDNKLILEYSSDSRIFSTTYELVVN